jgi:hypothetical protein
MTTSEMLLSASSGKLDRVRCLIVEGGMHVDAQNNNGEVYMEHCSMKSDIKFTFEWFLSSNNRLKDNGWTAMFYAADNGHLTLLQWLLEQGASVDTTDCHGFTALYYVQKNLPRGTIRDSIIELLLVGGCVPCTTLVTTLSDRVLVRKSLQKLDNVRRRRIEQDIAVTCALHGVLPPDLLAVVKTYTYMSAVGIVEKPSQYNTCCLILSTVGGELVSFLNFTGENLSRVLLWYFVVCFLIALITFIRLLPLVFFK